ncbi:hypothetical protein DPMN_059550 [Dreissena polymorpha]|uniref:G-protein coupled receptors family 1 profile domain-containing protein n=1 Tax=Dreissena polymorpha TaxID=45954 RepID=A0A9D4C469_DREPO|nr:hypothetical protein DPMN_059550 [Dreissena polymorpha]
MIFLCVLFFLTITPLSVGMVYSPYQRKKLQALASVDPYTAWHDFQYFQFLYDVVVLVSYFNATFNFAIYVFSVSKFRTELRSLLCCRAKQGTCLFESFFPTLKIFRRSTYIIGKSCFDFMSNINDFVNKV